MFWERHCGYFVTDFPILSRSTNASEVSSTVRFYTMTHLRPREVFVKERGKDKCVLQCEEMNVDEPNLIEGDVTFRRMAQPYRLTLRLWQAKELPSSYWVSEIAL